jgi:hypothetical protein
MPTKKRSTAESRFNALSAKMAVTPPEDAARYESFVGEILKELDPKTGVESSLAHAVADGRWRLERLSEVENDFFYRPAHADPEDLLLIQTFRERLEQRVNGDWDALSRAQKERKAARVRDLDEAVEKYNACRMNNLHFDHESDGFGFSLAQIAARSDYKRRLWEARALHRPNSLPKDPRR